ncbi:hypothetical protein RSPO_m01374 (plasmid) [Ralstonia solanacearum Po82]|uniref:Uncharacterized protein n=1 Tax=Ralstonia solanacearum (strain Po82) TaxID=1031711 RepID=F6GAU0_RALS8|nr:hypothetical protein RSPO_m01374 [Ralstonia solanacearum Po82]
MSRPDGGRGAIPVRWRLQFVKAQIIMRTIPIYKGVKQYF